MRLARRRLTPNVPFAVRRGVAVLTLAAFGACGGTLDTSALTSEAIFDARIPGTSGGTLTIDAKGPSATKLFEVTGDWNDVSVEIARLAIEDGWTIEGINCVGTGNDVIARKQVDGRWLLLESGAGTRGAGVIVSVAPEQRSPDTLTETGPCPNALSAAVRP